MKKDSRDLILDAADRVLNRSGLAPLTIDVVAAEANMSKGGVLHYFASKQDLLVACLTRFEERYFERRDALLATLPESPSRLARATFLTIVDTRKTDGEAGHYRIDMQENPVFREIIGRMKRRLYEDLFKGARHPEKVMTILYLMDGLWMNSMFSPSPVPQRHISKSRASLMEMIEGLWDDYQ